MEIKLTTSVDFLFNAIHNNVVKVAKKHLEGAKEELELVRKFAAGSAKCANAVERLSKVIQFVQADKFEEAKSEEIMARGAYIHNLRSFVLDQKAENKEKSFKNTPNPNTAIQQDMQHEKQQNEELQKSKISKTMSGEQSSQAGNVENSNKAVSNQAQPPPRKVLNTSYRDEKANHVGGNRSKTEIGDGQTIRGKQASQAIQRNNPDIADLSDVNRPTKLAERFSELYDNEWTEAFDYLHSRKNIEETKSIEYLLCIIDEAYRFCRKKEQKQITNLAIAFLGIIEQGKEWQKERNAKDTCPEAELSKEYRCILVQLRKEIAAEGISKLQEDFLEVVKNKIRVQTHIPVAANAQILDHYYRRAVELTWWMCVQDPPVYMCPTDDNTKADKNLYRAYTKSGDVVDFFVWPALRLYEEGGVLAKGVVQYK